MKAISWLDEMVDTADKLRELASDDRYDAFGTRMIRKEFMFDVEGFEHLAHDTNAVITYNPNWSDRHPDTGEEYFEYRGYKFFALWDKKGFKDE